MVQNLNSILNLYREDEKTSQIIEQLKSGDTARIQLKGILGSSIAFIASAVFKNLAGTSIFIFSDKEEAIYFFNDLENLLPENSVLFFPSSYSKPYQVDETDNSNVLLRAEVLNQIRYEKDLIIVTYPEALTEKVVTKTHLEKNTLGLKQGEKISIDFIVEVLFEYGFQREEYVIEPGQFSVRGGILDVFSFSNDQPYRIEFFGDDVESIRSFDPVSQLSVQKLNKINIIPNIENKSLQENRETFFEYIPEKTCIWIKEVELVADKIQTEYENSEKNFAVKRDDDASHPFSPEELYINREQFIRQFQNFSVIEFGNRSHLHQPFIINYNFSSPPLFHKNFDLLTQALTANTRKGFHNIIFADTPKQTERIHAIFEDIGRSIEFTPILLSIHEGFIDNDLQLACYTDHQIFERYHRFKLKSSSFVKNEALTLKELKGLNPGDYVTHIDHGIGRFGGLEKIEVNGKYQEAIRLVYKDNDVVYVSIQSLHRIAKYSGKEGAEPKINKIGSNAWANLKQKTKKKVKEIAFDLIQLYAKRKAQQGFQFAPDTYLQNELEASFIYEDTPDQLKSTIDVKKDMESPFPMDRLICGDVGFGKTEIAIRAAFKAVTDSKQVAILVPTTILALQHYKTFKERLKDFPCKVDYINRFKTAKEQKDTLEKLERGEIDIIVGTHRLVGKDIKFKDLGLLIIDEEQKFGVSVKEKLKTIRVNVDTLTLTATPIPRTLQFSMMGARDLSIINTPPPNRYPVQTELHVFNEEVIKNAILFEVERGGQVFFVHNRVQTIIGMAELIQKLCPDVKIAVAHGQMEGDKLETIMVDFINGDYDVLVATTIIESGLDISNANTIIIHDAHIFGLSDLHQLRGRVGRSNKKAFCYLFVPPLSALTDEARKRLKAIEELSELGSGFNIAMRDLDIRGAGNLLGAEQSGFITEIGFDMYQKILDEAVQELKEEIYSKQAHTENGQAERVQLDGGIHYPFSAQHLFVKDCQIDTDLEILIPDDYVNNITERLNLYRELDSSQKEEDLIAFENQLKDRFGTVPKRTTELINTVRLRWIAIEIGFERLILKNNKLTGYFISKHDSPYYQSEAFTKVLSFVQHNPLKAKMKEANNKLSLSFENIRSVDAAIAVVGKLRDVRVSE